MKVNRVEALSTLGILSSAERQLPQSLIARSFTISHNIFDVAPEMLATVIMIQYDSMITVLMVCCGDTITT